VKKFLESPHQETRDVDMATITGVGSSAPGSALDRIRCVRARCVGSRQFWAGLANSNATG
jgi:hypothetical protein